MFDIGWQELFLIGVVTLIVVGPKDLPKVLRTSARFMQKARAMSREFQNGLAEMAREAELDDIKQRVESAARFDLGDELRKSVDPTGKLSTDFDPAEYNRRIKEAMEGGPRREGAAGPPGEDTLPPPPPDNAMPPLPDPHHGPEKASDDREPASAEASEGTPPPGALGTPSPAPVVRDRDRPLRP